MNENEILQGIYESKAKQALRDSINNNLEFMPETDLDKKVQEDYNQMTEEQKQQFTQKGWKNG